MGCLPGCWLVEGHRTSGRREGWCQPLGGAAHVGEELGSGWRWPGNGVPGLGERAAVSVREAVRRSKGATGDRETRLMER